MASIENWDGVLYDTKKLTNASTYNFFENNECAVQADIATRKPESAIIKWIFEEYVGGKNDLMYNILEIPDSYEHFFDCREFILHDPYNEPDIDILLINNTEPQLSIAFQVKRVIMEIYEDGSYDFNRVKKISALITQANKVYEKYRFHKNYLMTITIINNKYQISNDDIENAIYEAIHSHDIYIDLNNDIGRFGYEIYQTGNESIDIKGKIFSKELRKPKQIDQNSNLTENIISYYKKYAKSRLTLEKY